MAIQTVALDLKGIDDAQGYAAVERALGTIGGVTAMRLDPAAHRVLVEYDDTQTSVHAFKAALTTVDYISEPFPIDAPANPNNDRNLIDDLEDSGKL